MNWFKDIIKAIGKRKLIYFLLLIQLMISLFTAYKGIIYLNSYKEYTSKIDSFNDVKNTYMVRLSASDEIETKMVTKKFDFSKSIKDKSNYKVVGITESSDEDMTQYLAVDYSLLDIFKVNIAEGNLDSKKQYAQGLASYDLKEKYKIGDKVQFKDLGEEFQIVGFLEKNHVAFDPLFGDFQNAFLVFSDDWPKTSNRCLIASKEGYKDTKSKITNILSPYGTTIFEVLLEDLTTYKESKIIKSKNLAVYSLAMFIFSMSVFVALMILIVNDSKKDIGIKLACGARRINIYCNIIEQMIFMYIVAISFCLPIQSIFWGRGFWSNIPIEYLWINISALTIIFLSSIPIFIKVMKLKPAELIKNE